MKNFYFFSFLLLGIIRSLTSFAQTDPYPYRGLYVDKFVKVSNPSSTILGQALKEDSLLRYARDNDFKYLILYDVEGVLDHLNTKFPTDTSKTYSQVFCNFILKAKTQYCVEHIGVSLAAANYFDSVGVYNTLHITAPYTFQSGNGNFFQAANPNSLVFVQTQDSVQQESVALITEIMNQGLPTDIQRQQFFDNLKQRNVGGLEEIHKALEDKNYLQAITKLINFQPENTIEQNLKDVFGLMEKIHSDIPLSLDDSLVLDQITEQLAFEGGPGVFISRAIMDEEFDDELTGSLLRQSNIVQDDTEPDILLYPNPSSGKAVISKNLSQFGGCWMEVRDVHGRIYLSSKLDENETIFEKDLSFLSSGLYNLQIYCDEIQIESLKLIIQK